MGCQPSTVGLLVISCQRVSKLFLDVGSTSFVIRRFPTTFSIDKIHDETAEESLVLDGNTEEGKLRSQE